MADCLFCRIINKTIPAKVKFENESLIAIEDINPQAPVHLLVIPKKHIEQVADAQAPDSALLGNLILTARELAKREGVLEGFRLVFNNGAEAWQSVFHIHLHLLGGRKMKWPPG